MTECLAGDEIRKLNRDLQLLIATNGTLTRILRILADEEIVVQVVKQKIHCVPPGESGPLPGGSILRRRVLLTGRRSGHRFVAAESLIAVDRLPSAITASLTGTPSSIGEVMAGSRLETFKEAAEVWIGDPPHWLTATGYRTSQRKPVGRRYRIIAGGQPVMVIAEYFLDSCSTISRRSHPKSVD